MARGRGLGGVVIVTSSGADDAILGTASSRAGRLASYTISDQDDVRRKSRQQDKALLDNITNRLASQSAVEDRRSRRLRVTPIIGKGGARSYVTYYTGDITDPKIAPRFETVTSSLKVLPPRHYPRAYSYVGGLGRRIRRPLDYLDLQSTYVPRPSRARRFDYLDLSLPLDIHNYLEAGRYASHGSYVPRYYRSSFDDSDIFYRPRSYAHLANIYRPSAAVYESYADDLMPSPRSRPMYPYDYDLQLYPEVVAPQRRAVTTSVSRVPMAPRRPAVAYYDDIEWPDYRPSAIRFQPVRDGPVLGAGASTSLAVKNARRSLFRIERELGDYGQPYSGYEDVDDYLDYVPARRTTVVRSAARPVVGGTTTTTVRRSALPAPKSRYREIEARLDLMTDPIEPPSSQLSTLRSRALDARSKMDRHKVLLDRYLPVPAGPMPAVEYEVESKYDELAQRMPSLARLSGGLDEGYSPASVKPYTPAPRPRSNSYSGPSRTSTGFQPSFRPPVSDVRKRCRQVLCKTKGDPSYYR